ncbi:MAG: hypothetical protein EBR28_14400, partial [Planctomycetia bacterium]|nr:hypothetical protein [Planctomycetia bacterium]
YLVGDTSTSGNGSTFLTYDTSPTAFGLRPLAASEYTTLTAGYTSAATAENVNNFNGTIATSSGVTVNSLRFSTAGALDGSGGGLTVNSGAILATASGTIGSGFSGLTLGNGTWNEGVITPTSGNTLTINAPITVTGNGGLTKGGAGTLVLGGSNTIAGGVTVQSGAIQVNNANALGSGALTFNVNADTTIPFNLPTSGTIANNITINTPGTARTYTFQQNQSNNLTLAGNITAATGNAVRFQLATGVSSGTFTLSGSNSFGGVDVFTGANVTFRFGGTNAAGLAPNWRPDTTANFLLLDGAVFKSTVGNSIASYGMETSGTASLTSDVYGSFAVNTPTGAELSFTGVVRSAGAATTKTGGGTMIATSQFNSVRTYSVLGGTLQVPVFSALGGSSGASYLVLDGGTLRYTGAAASTAKEFTLGASGGGLDASGSGTVSFTSTSPVSFTGSGN